MSMHFLISLAIDIMAAPALCLYLADYELRLFRGKGGNRSACLLGGAALLLNYGVYLWRQLWVIDDPLLNIKYLLLFFLFLAAAVIDAQYYIIPNQIIAAGLILWAAVSIATLLIGQDNPVSLLAYSGLGLIFGTLPLLVCRWLMKNSIGFGDIKLMGVIGMVCGCYKAFRILCCSLIIFFFFGLVLLAFKRVGRHTRVPMAPFLLAGYVCILLLEA